MKINQTDTIHTIHKAVNRYLDFISPTYGPAGKKVLVMNSEYDIQAIDDGQKGSEAFEIDNELENAVVAYQKETAKKMNSDLGDGRATCVLISCAIVNEILKDIDSPYFDKDFYYKVLEVQKAIPEAVEYIRSKAKEIKNKNDLYKIAYNSFKDDEIANIISDTLLKIGKDGVITPDDSSTGKHEVEIVEGLELDKGVVSRDLFNVDKKEEASLKEEPSIILIHKRIDSFGEIFPIVKHHSDLKKEMVIIAESFSEEAVFNIVMGRKVVGLKPILIEIPGYGDDKFEYLKDIASITGATILDGKNIKIKDFKPEHCGVAKKVTATQYKTTIIGGTKAGLEKRVAELESKLVIKNLHEKDKLIRRIASLKGGIALLKIGAYTDNEQKAIKAKASDAINATRIAYKDGVVKGGGKTYADIKTSSEVLNNVLKFPLEVLKKNGERYLDDNVLDPAGVLIGALEIGGSIGCGILTIGPIAATKRKKEDKDTF